MLPAKNLYATFLISCSGSPVEPSKWSAQIQIIIFVFYFRKARRRDRDSAPGGSEEHKLYLEEPLLRRLPEVDIIALTDQPIGLMWLASHSKLYIT